MYVKDQMTADPYTISQDAPITDVISMMYEKNLRRVPVVGNKGRLVGIITNTDIYKVSPTKATTLSVYEVNYLLAKTFVKDAMRKDVVTISPNSLIEEAAVEMRKHHVGTLVVVEDDRIVGIITESSIFDAFIESLGCRDKGARLSLTAKDVPGVVADIAGVFLKHNANISHIANFSEGGGMTELIIRTRSLNTDDIERELEERGYRINSVTKNAE